MMSEKRFTYGETIDYNFFDVFEEQKYLGMIQRDSTKIVDRLNEQQSTIEELQQKYDKLCIEMANIYSKYIFMKEFSEDTNPNEAVKYVLRELMQKTKGAR